MLSHYLIAFFFKNPEKKCTSFCLYLLSFSPLCSRQVILDSLHLIWLAIISFWIPADSPHITLQKNSTTISTNNRLNSPSADLTSDLLRVCLCSQVVQSYLWKNLCWNHSQNFNRLHGTVQPGVAVLFANNNIFGNNILGHCSAHGEKEPWGNAFLVTESCSQSSAITSFSLFAEANPKHTVQVKI